MSSSFVVSGISRAALERLGHPQNFRWRKFECKISYCGEVFGRANGNSREVPCLEYRGGGVFNALDYRDGAVFVTSQETVALVADQTAEATRIHPAAPVSVPRAKTTQSEGKGGEEPTQHDARAAQVRAALDGVKLEGIDSRYGYRFANGLRMHRISLLNCSCIGGMKTQFLAKPVFGVSPEHSGALFQKSNNGLAEAAW